MQAGCWSFPQNPHWVLFDAIRRQYVYMANDQQGALHLVVPSHRPGESPSSLCRAAAQGALLRLKPGVYVERRSWERAPLWTKHRAFAAAVALSIPSAILCRETALAIYGVPLLRVRREVELRTLSASMVGTAAASTLSSVRSPGFRLRRIGPPVPRGVTARSAHQAYRAGESAVRPMLVEAPGVVLSDGIQPLVTVEPLPFALLDTLPRASFEFAAVALDAVLAGRYGYRKVVRPMHLEAVEEWLWSRDAQAAWRSMVDFADPRSESPGESRSRALIHQLGFAAPELQREVVLPSGRQVRLDFDWVADGVAGEFDGRVKYQGAAAGTVADGTSVYWDEKWREEEIEEHTGKRFVRWQWADLDNPRRLERRLMIKGVSKR